jgi:hypothetical protein
MHSTKKPRRFWPRYFNDLTKGSLVEGVLFPQDGGTALLWFRCPPSHEKADVDKEIATMTIKQRGEGARAFLDAYRDPEIDKRLYFEVWADRKNLTDLEHHHVWGEVRRLTHRIAAKKRQEAHSQRGVARRPVPLASHDKKTEYLVAG